MDYAKQQMDLFYTAMTENDSFIKGSDKAEVYTPKDRVWFATLQYMMQRDMYSKTSLDAILVPHFFFFAIFYY